LSSSVIPLRLATGFGILVSMAAFVGAVLILLLGIFRKQLEAFGISTVPGTVTVLISILFLGGVQLVCLGIIGEYLGRIYENVKGRPFWTIRETLGIGEPDLGFPAHRPTEIEPTPQFHAD
jgi:hypothetical protein